MPYCPKCDMEFVEGVTVCTDCGGPLVSSKEEYERQKQMEEEAEKERLQKQLAARDMSAAIPAVAPRRRAQQDDVYVSKAERYDDYSSSATAFIIVGITAIVVAVLGFMGIFPLPFYGLFKDIMLLLITLMGIASLVVAYRSFRTARMMKGAAAEEKKETDELISRFLENYSAADIDKTVNAENPQDLAPEERTLKRLLIIQDILITGNDISDQAYVDELAEEIYDRMFED